MFTAKCQCLNPTADFVSESSVIRLIKLRDRTGLDYLHAHYQKALYRLILRIVKVDVMAEEVLQDVFLNIWQHIDSYDTYQRETIYLDV